MSLAGANCGRPSSSISMSSLWSLTGSSTASISAASMLAVEPSTNSASSFPVAARNTMLAKNGPCEVLAPNIRISHLFAVRRLRTFGHHGISLDGKRGILSLLQGRGSRHGGGAWSRVSRKLGSCLVQMSVCCRFGVVRGAKTISTAKDLQRKRSWSAATLFFFSARKKTTCFTHRRPFTGGKVENLCYLISAYRLVHSGYRNPLLPSASWVTFFPWLMHQQWPDSISLGQ